MKKKESEDENPVKGKSVEDSLDKMTGNNVDTTA